MNYLESSEYIDAKDQLKYEYKICLNKIETYIQLANIYGLHKEDCLIQVLDDFLSAQAEGKQVIDITGPDLKKYCETMIKAEKSRKESRLEVIAMLTGVPLTVMFISLLTTILRNDGIGNFSSSVNISAFSLSFPALFLIYFIFKRRTARVLFDHPTASRVITTIVSVIVLGSIYTISIALDNILNIVITIPFPLCISVIALSISILVFIAIITRVNNERLKIIPEIEEFTIEQVICPMCGKEYDMDYPKCPYCKNK